MTVYSEFLYKFAIMYLYAKKILTCMAALTCCVAVLSLTGGSRVWTPLTGRSLTTQSGLPSNRMNDMVQDSTGYIWLGTSNGLCRYDGYAVVPFHAADADTRSLTDNVGTLHLDTLNSLLWIRSATFHYSCLDLRQGRYVDYAPGCDHSKTFERFVAEPGGMWMYEAKAGIRHVTYGNGDFMCKDYTPGNGLPEGCKVKRIVVGNGSVWVLTTDGLLRLNAKGGFDILAKDHDFMMANSWRNLTFFLTRSGRVMAFDKHGKMVRNVTIPQGMGDMGAVNGNMIWQDRWLIMTRNTVVAMDCRTMEFSVPADLQMDYGIVLDNLDGNLCVSDRLGAFWLFMKDGRMRRMQLLREDDINIKKKRNYSTIICDDGRFYIATYGNGLYIYDPVNDHTEHFSAKDPYPILDTDYLTNIHKDRDGNVWIGQEDAGVTMLRSNPLGDYGIIMPDPLHQGEKTNFITRLRRRSDGNILVTTKSHRSYVLNADGTFHATTVAATPDSHTDSLTDKQGRTWIATWEQGLIMATNSNDGQRKLTYLLTRSISESRINALTTDKNGNLWVATYNGIYIADISATPISNASFRRISISDGLPTNDITCLLSASDGSVWAGGAGSGAIRCVMRKGKTDISTVSTMHGLSNDNVHSITEDLYGNIWVTTDEAVSTISPKTMKAVNHSVGTSLLNRLYSDNCALTLSDGRLLFGTHDGITVITPQDKPMASPHNSMAHITDVIINGASIYNNEKFIHLLGKSSITLPYDENTVRLCFSDFNYANAGQTLYQFYLEGYDKTWRTPSSQNYMEYGNLPPGTYTFHLRLDGGAAETVMEIRIRQPWYNTWWAWMMYISVIAALITIFYRHKRQQIMLRQQMRMEREVADMRINLFTQIAHEFRTPLALISGAIDRMGEAATPKKQLQTAQRGAVRMTRLVNQLMEFRKIDTDNLRLKVEQGDIVRFVRDISHDFWNVANQKDISLTFQSSEKSLLMPFDRHIVDAITYNIISNAVKYTPVKGTVSVRLRSDVGKLCLTVDDSGPGIDDGRLPVLFQPFMHGFASQGGMGIGLYTAHKMALTHKGSLTYQRSSSLGGACFTLTLPLDGSAYSAEDYMSGGSAVSAVTRHDETPIIHEPLPQALNDLHIAVIEDDPDMLEQIKSEMGVYFHVDAYTTGKDGYERVCERKPALLICDVTLPDMSGYDIVRQLRSHADTMLIPVIMLTALDDDHHRIKGYEAGADDYMVKPCNYQVLAARTAQLIKWNRERMAAPAESQQAAAAAPTDVAEPVITSRADKRFAEQVDRIIEQHLGDSDFSVDQMAEMLHIGRTKLFGKIKELKGMSPNKLLVSERMKRAAVLLDDVSLNISEVSYKVGIKDASYFNRCFKQYYGMSPKQYRDRG